MTNIGVHFFDMLCWIFGPVKKNIVNIYQPRRSAGILELERARVRWFLSLDKEDLPIEPKIDKPRTYRSITVDGEEIEFSGGFEDLHTDSYKAILAGNGFELFDVKPSIEIVSEIRKKQVVGLNGNYHPMLNNLTDLEA